MSATDKLLQQKLLFARSYRLKPNEAVMIVGSIFGTEEVQKDALRIINLARDWAIDPIVLAEIERLDNTPVSKREYITEIHETARQAKLVGDFKAFNEGMKLVAELEGYIKQSAKDSGKSDDKLAELAFMVVDPTNVGDDDKPEGSW